MLSLNFLPHFPIYYVGKISYILKYRIDKCLIIWSINDNLESYE